MVTAKHEGNNDQKDINNNNNHTTMTMARGEGESAPAANAKKNEAKEALTSAPGDTMMNNTAGKQEAFTSRPGPAVIKLKLKNAPTAATGTQRPAGIGMQSMPTPPNSISPTIPPARGLAGLKTAEKELDLNHGHTSPGTSTFSADALESLGSITPQYLAQHHLPHILLTHGPLAIRHIMGYLTTSVPGFSSIAPAKARRIVVGALEGKGGSAASMRNAQHISEMEEGHEYGYGGSNGEVRFEKVGWGRWDARVRGQGMRSPALSPDLPFGMPIGGGMYSNIRRERVAAPSSSSNEHSRDVEMDGMDMDVDMEDEEIDRMSLDDPCSSSEAPTDIEDEMLNGDDSEDMTDDEDWAAVGAAALRQHSYQGSAPLGSGSFGGRGGQLRVQHVYTGGSRSYSYAGQGGGVGAEVRPKQPVSLLSFQKRPAPTPLSRSSLMVVEDRQERDAVEALMRLGSV